MFFVQPRGRTSRTRLLHCLCPVFLARVACIRGKGLDRNSSQHLSVVASESFLNHSCFLGNVQVLMNRISTFMGADAPEGQSSVDMDSERLLGRHMKANNISVSAEQEFVHYLSMTHAVLPGRIGVRARALSINIGGAFVDRYPVYRCPFFSSANVSRSFGCSANTRYPRLVLSLCC